MPIPRILTVFGLILGGGALAALSDDSPEPALASPLPVQVATIQNPQITECSGLTASRRYPGFLWTHNDSGDSARVFLLSSTGETVATVTLKGASARDWEDITFAGGFVYVADTGDNFAWRDAVQIYRFKEPALDPQKRDQTLQVTPETLALRYLGAPRDAETLLASPDGRVWILSKEKGGSTLFVAPFKKGKTKTLKKVGSKINFGGQDPSTSSRLATAGEFSSDGRKLAVVTGKQLMEWKLPAPFDASHLSTLKPAIRALPPLSQCESVCYSADGKQIFVSSEGQNPPIYSFDSSY